MLKQFQTQIRLDQTNNRTERNLVLLILGTCLAGTVVLYFSGASPQFMLPLCGFLLLAIFLALRGYVRLAGILGPLAGQIIIAILIFNKYGIRDTAILVLPAIIIAASLMNGRRGTLAFGAMSLLLVIARGISESMGLIINYSGIPNTTC